MGDDTVKNGIDSSRVVVCCYDNCSFNSSNGGGSGGSGGSGGCRTAVFLLCYSDILEVMLLLINGSDGVEFC